MSLSIFKIPSGGLAFWAEWKKPVNLMNLSKKCARNNLFIPKNLLYQNRKLTAMRLGFGNFTESEMEKAVEILSMNAKSMLIGDKN